MVASTPAVLLRSYRYGETSRILRFHSPDHGVVAVMAKGWGASGGKGRGVTTFTSGNLILYMKQGRDLHTMKDFAAARQRRGLGSHPLRLAAASVVGELVLRNVGEGAHPGVHDLLEAGLDTIESCPADDVVGAFVTCAWRIVVELGYAPVLDACVRCGSELREDEIGRFDFAEGGLRCARCSEGLTGPRLGGGARQQLRSLVEGVAPAHLVRPRAHVKLLSDFVTYHIGEARPLESVDVLLSLLGETPRDTTDA